ncbi:MAG: hypothetical protein ABW066_15765 [Sedimenticola sp.]
MVEGYAPGRDKREELISVEDHVLVPASIETRKYDPFEVEGLFKTFSSIETTTGGILKFAKKYGTYDFPQSFVFPNKSQAEDFLDPQSMVKAEPLKPIDGDSINKWFVHIRLMKLMIDLWENIEAIAPKCIHWEGYDRVFYETPNGKHLIASHDNNRHLFRELRPGDSIQPAKAYLLSAISDQLQEVTLAMSIIDGRPQPFIKPSKLLDAMWLQFAMAIAEEKQFKACEYCGTYFEVKPGRGQKTKRFCSVNCRTMANRKKHHEAAKS